jgi:hypothetical protein
VCIFVYARVHVKENKLPKLSVTLLFITRFRLGKWDFERSIYKRREARGEERTFTRRDSRRAKRYEASTVFFPPREIAHTRGNPSLPLSLSLSPSLSISLSISYSHAHTHAHTHARTHSPSVSPLPLSVQNFHKIPINKTTNGPALFIYNIYTARMAWAL